MESIFIENKIDVKDGRKVSGYIARFDRPYFDGSQHSADMYRSQLEAFDKDEIRIPLLWLHSTQDGRPIGAMTSYTIDDKGIFAEFNLSDTPFVRDEVIPSIQSGAMTHFSTEEGPVDEQWTEWVILAVALVPIGNAINARVEEMNRIGRKQEPQPEPQPEPRKSKAIGIIL